MSMAFFRTERVKERTNIGYEASRCLPLKIMMHLPRFLTRNEKILSGTKPEVQGPANITPTELREFVHNTRRALYIHTLPAVMYPFNTAAAEVNLRLMGVYRFVHNRTVPVC